MSESLADLLDERFYVGQKVNVLIDTVAGMPPMPATITGKGEVYHWRIVFDSGAEYPVDDHEIEPLEDPE